MSSDRDAAITVSDDVAFEYLDDGGLLVSRLVTGEPWQLSAPAGQLWRWILRHGRFRDVATTMVQGLGVTEAEATSGLGAFCQEMESRGLLTVTR